MLVWVGHGQLQLVKPPVGGLLLLDVLPDFFGVPADRVHEVAACPQVLAGVVALVLQEVPGDMDGALAFDKADHRRNRQLGRHVDEHVHMAGQNVALLDATLFLLGQRSKHGAESLAHDAKERSSPVLGDKHDVVFALPFAVTQTAVVFHGFLWVVRFGRLTAPPHGRPLEKSNFESRPGRAGGTPIDH